MAKEETVKPKRGLHSKSEIQEEFEILAEASVSDKVYSNPKEADLLAIKNRN